MQDEAQTPSVEATLPGSPDAAPSNADLADANQDPHGMVPVFLPLGEFRPELSENAKALAYWAALPRKAGAMPLKDDFDVLDLAAHMPRCFMMDMIGPTNWRISMFGTELATHFGTDATGMNAYDFYEGEERSRVAQRMSTVCERSAAMCTTSRIKNAAGVTMDSEWLFLPLSDANGLSIRILVFTATFEKLFDLRDFEIGGTLEGRTLLKLVYGLS